MKRQVLNLNGNQDSQPVRGYVQLKHTPGNVSKAIESCVYSTMMMMNAGEDHANGTISNAAEIRSR